MSGIYLHIPFCKQACHYCDFHFSTNRKNIDDLVDTLCKELEFRKNYLGSSTIETVYFGGGTPSLLSIQQLAKIFSAIHKYYKVAGGAEITLEVNPDDVNQNLIDGWKSNGVNRISLGIQTFNDKKLSYINRSHDSKQAKDAIELIAGNFRNFNADLIYAIPPADMKIWEDDIQKLLTYDPTHVSIYGLTIEEKTAFGKWAETGKFQEIPETENLNQYQLAISLLENAGYLHYEVSNFSKPDQHSAHNTSYWKGKNYLGIGPGAHSFNRISRTWNVRNNQKYVQRLSHGELPCEEEILTKTDKQNEFMLTRIRNIWGIDLAIYEKQFGIDFLLTHEKFIQQLINDQYAVIENNRFLLTKKGWFLADEIASRLMV